MTYYDKVVAILKDYGFTQAEFLRLARLSRAVMSQWRRRGTLKPYHKNRIATVQALCILTGYDPETIAARTGDGDVVGNVDKDVLAAAQRARTRVRWKGLA